MARLKKERARWRKAKPNREKINDEIDKDRRPDGGMGDGEV
jgi:hypothetical protein